MSAGGEANHGTPWKGLLALFGLALGVRVLFLALEPEVALAGDEPSWTDIALAKVAKLRRPFSPWKSPLIFYPPGYPYFIAACYKLLGGLEAVRWVQALLGALLVPAVGRVGTLTFSPRTGLLAATIAALYPDLVWYSVHFWSETLFIVLLWWAFERVLTAQVSGRVGPALAGGLLWGLAALTRETVLHFAPVVGLALWLSAPRDRRALLRGAGFLLVAALSIAPWTYRNHVKFDAFVPISVFGPMNLWQGNTDLSRGELYERFDALPDVMDRYELAWREARREILSRQPTWLFEKLASELPRFFGVDGELVHFLGIGAYGPRGPDLETAARWLTGLPYVVVLVGFVAGLVALRPNAQALLLLLFLADYVAIHVVAYGADRFRVPILPVLFVVAAEAFAAWRDGDYPDLGRWRRVAAVALLLVLGILVLAGSPPTGSAAVP